jgi:hypothetical protein
MKFPGKKQDWDFHQCDAYVDHDFKKLKISGRLGRLIGTRARNFSNIFAF